MSSIKAIRTSQIELGIRHESQLDRIREDILDLAQATEQKSETRIADQIAQLESLRTKLNFLIDEHRTSARNVKVVKSLYFPEVRRRFEQILPKDQRSNEWIHDSATTEFVPWLESAAQGDSIFYIYGKVCLLQAFQG